MKNAAKASLAVIAACLGLGIGLAAFSVETIAAVASAAGVSPVQDASSKSSALPTSSGGGALPSASAPVIPAAPVVPAPSAPTLPSPVTATPASSTGANASPIMATPNTSAPPSAGISVSSGIKKEDPADGKVPESVRGIMKKLSSSDDKATVQDLNEAREAVAKLDLLLEIEKRLKDLTAIRSDREEKSMGSSFAGAIPASALGLTGGKKGGMPALSPAQALMASQMGAAAGAFPTGMPVMPVATKVEIDRIVGARGKYFAFLRVGDEHAKQYKTGDKLSDGRVIQSITSHGVTLARKNKVETLKVRGVSNIFGAP